jgi:hypothetical protein
LGTDVEELDRLARACREAGLRALALSHFDVAPAIYRAHRRKPVRAVAACDQLRGNAGAAIPIGGEPQPALIA